MAKALKNSSNESLILKKKLINNFNESQQVSNISLDFSLQSLQKKDFVVKIANFGANLKREELNNKDKNFRESLA
jgi:hypothetical protein